MKPYLIILAGGAVVIILVAIGAGRAEGLPLFLACIYLPGMILAGAYGWRQQRLPAVGLAIGLLLVGTAVGQVSAQDGSGNQQSNSSTTDQVQSVVIDQDLVCEAGATCQQSAVVGGQGQPAVGQGNGLQADQLQPEQQAAPERLPERGNTWWIMWSLMATMVVLVLAIFGWGQFVTADKW